MKLSVTTTDQEVTKEEIAEIFEGYGQVTSVKLFRSPHTQSVLAFVDMPDTEEALQAASELNDTTVDGIPLQVANTSQEKIKAKSARKTHFSGAPEEDETTRSLIASLETTPPDWGEQEEAEDVWQYED
ncbi:MAG: RNA-binding protein [Bacteroidota bacterium]